MVDAAPFRALRYEPSVAGDPASTSAPPYDELEPFAYARHRAASPYTVVELIAAHPAGYQAAGATLRRWRRTGVLVADPRAAFYRYEIHELRRGAPAVVRGVLAALRLEPCDGSGAISAHEGVDDDRVADRLRRLEAAPVDLSPVLGLYRGAPEDLRRLLAGPPRTPPVAAMTDEAGADHRVWALDDPAEVAAIRRWLASVPVVIADGHHRYAAALAFSRHRRAALGTTATADPAWERTLVYLVDSAQPGLQILPVHRVVRGLPRDTLSRLTADFRCQATGPLPDLLARLVTRPGSQGGPVFGLYLPGGPARLLVARQRAALAARLPPERSGRWRRLDSAVLHHAVLPGLGEVSVGYHSDALAAAAEVDADPGAGLFLLRPVTAATVHAVAAAGQRMPPKTTWFRPKPRTGLVMRAFAD